MNTTYRTVNEILVELFNEIMRIEEKAVITEEFKDISNNDMHIIDVIGKQASQNMSSIAKALGITVGTLTIAINNLVKKGYVSRARSENDRRVVLISLTQKGHCAFEHHRLFHEHMVDATVAGFNESDKETLIRALQNLKTFFYHYTADPLKKP